MLNFDEIKELLELVAAKGLDGLEIERAGFRLAIHGKSETDARQPVAAAAAPSAIATAATPAVTPEPIAEPTAAAVPDGIHVVSSPIVGTFFAAPSPDADTFVQTGDRVRKGQVLCIVEAMKLMNEIESDADGVVVEIYPSNGQPVEFGERLFAIQSS